MTKEPDHEADGSPRDYALLAVDETSEIFKHGYMYIYFPSKYSATPGTPHEMAVLFQKVRKMEIAGSEEGEG